MRSLYLVSFICVCVLVIAFLFRIYPILNKVILIITDNNNSNSALLIVPATKETTEYENEIEHDSATAQSSSRKVDSMQSQHYNSSYFSQDDHTTSIVFLTGSSTNHMKALMLDLLPSIERHILGPHQLLGQNNRQSSEPGRKLKTKKERTKQKRKDKEEQKKWVAIDFQTADIKVIHYNLDPIETRKLNQEAYQDLSDAFPFVEWRDFNYSAHPSFFNVEENAGEYAWKGTIINLVVQELSSSTTTPGSKKYSQSFLYWLDAGIEITSSKLLQKDFRIAKKQGIYTPRSLGALKTWTRQETSDYLGLDFDVYNNTDTRIGSGGIVLVDITNETIKNNVIKPWASCSQHKECIAPEGSNRHNHRQDQSVLSVILNRVNIEITGPTKSTTRGGYELYGNCSRNEGWTQTKMHWCCAIYKAKEECLEKDGYLCNNMSGECDIFGQCKNESTCTPFPFGRLNKQINVCCPS